MHQEALPSLSLPSFVDSEVLLGDGSLIRRVGTFFSGVSVISCLTTAGAAVGIALLSGVTAACSAGVATNSIY